MPRPRINPEHRTPTFTPIERHDPNMEAGADNMASLILFAEYPDDEFPHFEVSTTMFVNRDGEFVEADLNDDEALNDPQAITIVRVSGPVRLEADGRATWGFQIPTQTWAWKCSCQGARA